MKNYRKVIDFSYINNGGIFKLLILLLSLSLFYHSSCSTIKSNSHTNCKNKFSGKWKYDELPISKIYVVRTKKKQFEYIDNRKYYYEYDIKWLSKCNYQMTYVKTNSPKPAIAKTGETLTVEIINMKNNKMWYKTQFRDMQEVGEMTKIE